MTTYEDEDTKAHSDVEGRTVQRALYRRLSSSGYRDALRELLRDKYNPLRAEPSLSQNLRNLLGSSDV